MLGAGKRILGGRRRIKSFSLPILLEQTLIQLIDLKIILLLVKINLTPERSFAILSLSPLMATATPNQTNQNK
jgi:hypothetical protein